MPKSLVGLCTFNSVCCTLIHLAALVSALWGTYLFFGTSFENVLNAFELLGVALALEAVAAVVGRQKTGDGNHPGAAPG